MGFYSRRFEFMKKLTEIANRHRTDKGTVQGEAHGFTEFYEPYWDAYKGKENLTVLEIGVQSGHSLETIEEFFEGKAQVYGIDINDGYQPTKPNIHTYICDQGDEGQIRKFLNKIGNIKFDIIIDDGSHQFVHQMTSLFAFMDSVKPDGIYVLEDLHTSLSWGSDAKNTPLYFLTFFDNVDCISTEKQGVLRERIKDVTVYNRKNPLGSCNKRSVTSIITFNQPGQ